jgi:hypothetical protein
MRKSGRTIDMDVIAAAIEPDELPRMVSLARLFLMVEQAGATLADDFPDLLPDILKYVGHWVSPEPTDEKQAGRSVMVWLEGYRTMYGIPDHIEEVDLGVDTLH